MVEESSLETVIALYIGSVGAMVFDGCAASRHQDWPCTLALSGIRSFVPAILASI
jgi:hypothetical protein